MSKKKLLNVLLVVFVSFIFIGGVVIEDKQWRSDYDRLFGKLRPKTKVQLENICNELDNPAAYKGIVDDGKQFILSKIRSKSFNQGLNENQKLFLVSFRLLQRLQSKRSKPKIEPQSEEVKQKLMSIVSEAHRNAFKNPK